MKSKYTILLSLALIIGLFLFVSSCEEDNSDTNGHPPSIFTNIVNNITSTTATSGGNVTDDGGSAVKARGICWNTNQNPTIEDNKTIDGSGVGSFTSNITGLDINTTYYVRAYATNANSTVYGNEISFTSLNGLTTTAISDITATTATGGGNITNDGGFAVTARGVCWSTSQNPTLSDNYTTNGSGTGSFASSLTGLTEWTTYYVRAYATNENGIAYGNEISFEAKENLTDYDGNKYEIVKIGNQIWMTENLKTTRYANGTEITLVESNTTWDALSYTDIAYCYYDNSTTNADTYGALYTWAAAMNGAVSSSVNPSGIQGVCPDGWHLPSDAEWKELEMYLGMSQTDADAIYFRGTNEGSKLAGNSGLWINGILEKDAAFGTSGFLALPAGGRDYDGTFYSLRNSAYFWSATKSSSSSHAWIRRLVYYDSAVGYYGYYKSNGLSVRCLKD